MKSEVKHGIQGTNSKEKETRTPINDLEQKKEVNIRLEHNEETKTQKHEERLRNRLDNFKRSNIPITRVPEGEEEEKQKTYLKK